MILTNNSAKGKWFFYKTDGFSKKVFINAYSEAIIPEIKSQSQVNLNSHDEGLINQLNDGKNFINDLNIDLELYKSLTVYVKNEQNSDINGALVTLDILEDGMFTGLTSSGYVTFNNLRKNRTMSLNVQATGYIYPSGDTLRLRGDESVIRLTVLSASPIDVKFHVYVLSSSLPIENATVRFLNISGWQTGYTNSSGYTTFITPPLGSYNPYTFNFEVIHPTGEYESFSGMFSFDKTNLYPFSNYMIKQVPMS